MKPNRVSFLVFLLLCFIPLTAFAQEQPRMISGNMSLTIREGARAYSMAEFTPRMPLKIEVKGPGKLVVYIKTAVYKGYETLPGFRLFVKRDNYPTNQYQFPATTRSSASFEGVKDYNPSVQTSTLQIDVLRGVHTYEFSLPQTPSIIGLASFGYTPEHEVEPVPPARRESFLYAKSHAAEGSGAGTWLYIKPYGMVGDVYEQQTNSDSVYGGVGVNADIFLEKHLVVTGIVNYTDADQRYLVWRNLPLSLGAGMYTVNEQTLLIQGIVSYAILHDDTTILMAGAGWGDLEIMNPSFPGRIDGPVVSVLFDRVLSHGVHLNIRPTYLQDVTNGAASTNSLLGTPYGFLAYPVGIAFAVASGVSVEVGYDGRLLMFRDTNRFYNGGFVAALF